MGVAPIEIMVGDKDKKKFSEIYSIKRSKIGEKIKISENLKIERTKESNKSK